MCSGASTAYGVQRPFPVADLGDEVLLDLIRHDDPLGVLSIYVDGESTVTGRGTASVVLDSTPFIPPRAT